MATQFEIDLSIMAGRAYQTTRGGKNWFPEPDGWVEFFHVPNASLATTGGFEAVSFQNTPNPNEIVISYAGTYSGQTGDLTADFNLATGNGSIQLQQAVEYYLQVKALNPNATITLTGHSLGGGLAALVGVFFGVKAVTFDQAPFANTAKATSSAADDLLYYLQNTVYTDAAVSAERDKAVTALSNFLQLRATNGEVAPLV